MSIERTQAVMEQFWEQHDQSKVAEDVVFTFMGTGQEVKGREAVAHLLFTFWNQIFQAHPVPRNRLIGDGQAVWEVDVEGLHLAEFAGIAASGQEVRVPLCVVYDLENDLIRRARVYFETDALRQQNGAA